MTECVVCHRQYEKSCRMQNVLLGDSSSFCNECNDELCKANCCPTCALPHEIVPQAIQDELESCRIRR